MNAIEGYAADTRSRDPSVQRLMDTASQSMVENAWFAAVAKSKRKVARNDVDATQHRTLLSIGTPLPRNVVPPFTT